jgi:transposase
MTKKKTNAASYIRDIKRKTHRRYSTEEKIRIVIEGLRGEESVPALCKMSIKPPPGDTSS